MFKRLFKKKSEPSSNIKKVTIPCPCDRDNEHCDLIIQLRKCQDLRDKIKNEIEVLDEDSFKLLVNIADFIYEFENHGLQLGSFGRCMTSERNVGIIKHTLSEYSSADIFRIIEELKTYKNTEDIICEKQRALKAVENDIKNIKTELGIE